MAHSSIPKFNDWVKCADVSRRGDPLWSVQAYRLSLYAVDCHARDRRENAALRSSAELNQLTRAIGSITANIAEGYSRSTVPDRARFYGYALGSTREAIAWYDSLKVELGVLADDRQSTLMQVRRLLLTTLRNARPDGAPESWSDLPQNPRPSDN
jgi:four helix bundle protein